jgi:hypothetical protein
MRKLKVPLIVFMALLCFSQAARAVGPVKISVMTRVENHSMVGKTIDNTTMTFGNETFGYQMISVSRELAKNHIGSIFYLTRYSFDDADFTTHIGGMNLIHIYNPYFLTNIGYTYTSNPEYFLSGAASKVDKVDRDRFSVTTIYTLNPKVKDKPKFSLNSSYSSLTDLGDSKVFSEELGAAIPITKDELSFNTAYSYVYSLDQDEQLANQVQGNLIYSLNKKEKVTLGAMFINNTFTGNHGDDTVFRLSYNANLR